MTVKSSRPSKTGSRLVLGTAQLGMNYGISNIKGKPTLEVAQAIVETAWKCGIREFDTAQAYAESENVLGNCLSCLGISQNALIISKIYPEIDHLDFRTMQKALERSLDNLNCDHLYGYMMHREELLDQWDKGLGEVLVNFLEKERLINNIGISVYTPNRALQALKNNYISFVQLPSNILDRRFEKAGVFQLAGRLQKKIYVRSVFLQGLLLMNTKDIPLQMRFALPVLQKVEKFTHEIGISKHALALGYAKIAYPNAKIIIGVETKEQLLENVKVWEEVFSETIVDQVRYALDNIDEKILNPACWYN